MLSAPVFWEGLSTEPMEPTPPRGQYKPTTGLPSSGWFIRPQRERILCGCYDTGVTNPTAADYQFGTTDKRFLRGAENTGRTISVFTSSDDNVSMVSEGTLCFSAIAGFTLEAVPDATSIDLVIGTNPLELTLVDGGNEVPLPFIKVTLHMLLKPVRDRLT